MISSSRDCVACTVADNLHHDVARLAEIFFHVDGGIAKRGLRLRRRLAHEAFQLVFRRNDFHAPSAAALRLQQLNKLTQLKRDLEEVAARAEGAAQAHAALQARLADLARADQMARDARRAADARVAETNRTAARAEADRSLAEGRLETARISVARYADEATEARERLEGALASVEDLGDLDTARDGVETARVAVEAARITMMSRRSAHEEVRREGEARVRRRQEATKELSGWKHRLDTAAKRIAELDARKAETEDELAEASAAPEAPAEEAPAEKPKRRAVVPSGPITGNSCLAIEAPD